MTMSRRNGLLFKRPMSVLIDLVILISLPAIRGSENGLTQSELKANYGQGI